MVKTLKEMRSIEKEVKQKEEAREKILNEIVDTIKGAIGEAEEKEIIDCCMALAKDNHVPLTRVTTHWDASNYNTRFTLHFCCESSKIAVPYFRELIDLYYSKTGIVKKYKYFISFAVDWRLE